MLEHFGAIFLFTTFTPHKREGLVRSAAPGCIPAREREDRGETLHRCPTCTGGMAVGLAGLVAPLLGRTAVRARRFGSRLLRVGWFGF